MSKKIFCEYKIEIGALGIGLLGVFLIFERVELKKILSVLLMALQSQSKKISISISDWIAGFSGSDLLGLMLILLVFLFLIWRTRLRFEKSDRWTADVCPRCGSGLHRVHRTSFDHFISKTLLPEARRYRCANNECVWEGLRRSRSSEHHHHHSVNAQTDR